MASIAFVTAADLSRYFPADEEPLLTHDDFVAAQALRDRNHRVTPWVWGTEPPEAFDLAIIRSPWDYQDSDENQSSFFEWLDLHDSRVRIVNPTEVLRWNLDKRYLADLEYEGVEIVPTEFFGADDSLSRDDLATRADGSPIVLKPCISAAARDTFLIDSREAAYRLRSHHGAVPDDVDLDTWREGRSFMVQPFLSEIRDRGEWSVVFLGGTLTHAVHKRPKDGSWWVQDELGGHVESAQPPDPVREAAEEAMAALPIACPSANELLYARVDVIESTDGPRISELELVEPELFFKWRDSRGASAYPPAIEAFVRGIEALCD